MRTATTVAKITSLLGVFVAISVLMGLIGAGLLLPVVGSAGTAAREGVGLFDELPGDLDSNPLAQQSRITAADGSLISTPALQNRIIVPLEEVAPVMQQAQVAIEDERYYEHGGVDPKALGRALVTNATSEDTQGGSTLTQQFVKLTLKEQAEREEDVDAQQALLARSGIEGYVRKLRELKYAVTLEDRLSKDDILEGYLNSAYYGDRAYGVEAAARHYFGVKSKKLNLVQAATLAGVVRAPSITDPVNSPKSSKARRDVVLDKMYAQKMITESEWEKAKKTKIDLDVTDSQQSCLNSKHPYFCDYVQTWLLQSKTLGDSREERERLLYTGGLTIETTLEPKLANEIAKVTADYVPPGNTYGLGSAAAMVEPGTGKVLAIGQSSAYSNTGSSDMISETSVNWSVDKRYGGGAGFQIGSIAKAFSLITALENGVTVEKTLNVRAPNTFQGRPAGFFYKGDFDPKCTIGEPVWRVRNAEDANFNRSITLRKATASSVNTAFATLASQVGTCKIKATMAKVGLNSGDGDEYGAGSKNNPPTYVLGADDASPLTVASAYATIASGGTYCPPVPVSKVTTADGKDIPVAAGKCKEAISPDVAAGVAELMGGVVDEQGSGFRAVLDNGQPAGGKTGTADGSVHTWFAGYTPQLSTAVWIGDPTGAKRYGGRLANITLGDRFIEGQLYGSKLGAPMWKKMMTLALKGKDVERFDTPSRQVMGRKQPPPPDPETEEVEEETELEPEPQSGQQEDQPTQEPPTAEPQDQAPQPQDQAPQPQATVPAVSGLNVQQAVALLSQAGLSSTRQRIAAQQPANTVLYTVPNAGQAAAGRPVTIFISNGPN